MQPSRHTSFSPAGQALEMTGTASVRQKTDNAIRRVVMGGIEPSKQTVSQRPG
jgi:hypothetical protein